MSDFILDTGDTKITWFKTFFEEWDYKKIGFKASAGVDSSLLLYILSYFIDKTESYDKVIYPYHGKDHSVRNVDSVTTVINIINFIRNKFPKVDIRDPYILSFRTLDLLGNNIRNNPEKEIYGKDTGCKFPKEAEKYLNETYDIDIFLNGRNLNISKEEAEQEGVLDTWLSQRDSRRDGNRITTAFDADGKYFAEVTASVNSPWHTVKKDGIKKLYEKFELMNTLYPMTISCTSFNGPSPCKTCHWCKEKYMTFGSYDGGIR